MKVRKAIMRPLGNGDLEDECNIQPRVTIAVRKGESSVAYEDRDEWQKSATPYRVTLMYRGGRLTVDWFQGWALSKEPTAADVLYCLLIDSQACGMDFEEWAREYGYGEDSRAAERLYHKCVEIGEKVLALLGGDLHRFNGLNH